MPSGRRVQGRIMVQRLSSLFLLLLAVSAYGLDQQFAGPAACRDADGNTVDWLFGIIENGSGQRFISISSKDVAEARAGRKPAKFQPLDSRRKIGDPSKSPLLRTIYGSPPATTPFDRLKPVQEQDNTVFIVYNDQPPGSSNKSCVDRDPAVCEVFVSSKTAKDVYGRGITEQSAHAKGIVAMQFSYDSPTSDDGHVQGFFIQHSIPKFLNMNLSKKGSVKRKALPLKSDAFGPNMFTPQSKAQHFFCTSFKYKQKLDANLEIPFNRATLEAGTKTPLEVILEYMETSHVALVGYNYDLIDPRHRVWHQYFGMSNAWTPTHASDGNYQSFNMPRHRDGQKMIKSKLASARAPPHLFPLGQSQWPVTGTVDKFVVGPKSGTFGSLRHSSAALDGKCQKWSTYGHQDPGCITSGSFTTTALQHPITVNVIAKHGAALVNAWDDLVTVAMLPRQDYESSKSSPSKYGKKYAALALIVQSWIDHSTLRTHAKDLINTEAFRARAWVQNSLGIRLPVSTQDQQSLHESEYKELPSASQNHSKIAHSALIGERGGFVPLVCMGDLNRTRKHVKLLNRDYGRGGGTFCVNSPELWHVLMSLQPITEENSDFLEVNPRNYLSHFKGLPQEMATVLKSKAGGKKILVKYEGRSGIVDVMYPFSLDTAVGSKKATGLLAPLPQVVPEALETWADLLSQHHYTREIMLSALQPIFDKLRSLQPTKIIDLDSEAEDDPLLNLSPSTTPSKHVLSLPATPPRTPRPVDKPTILTGTPEGGRQLSLTIDTPPKITRPPIAVRRIFD